MLTAVTKTDERVNAKDGIKGEDYFCRDCGSKVILRQGLVRIPHFAHESNSGNDCIFRGGGEGPNHDLMKTVVKKLLDEQNPHLKSEFEYRFDNGRIADICYKNNQYTIAVECVDKHTDLKDFGEKLEDYKRDNIKSMWIFDVKKFQDEDRYFKYKMRTTEIMRKCHKLDCGKIWAVDTENEEIYVIQLNYIFGCKSKKRIKYIPLKNLKFYPTLHYIVGPYYKTFWKITTLKEKGINMVWHKGVMDIYTPFGHKEDVCDCIAPVYDMLVDIGYSRTDITHFDKDLRRELKYQFELHDGVHSSRCYNCTIYKKYSNTTKCEYYLYEVEDYLDDIGNEYYLQEIEHENYLHDEYEKYLQDEDEINRKEKDNYEKYLKIS